MLKIQCDASFPCLRSARKAPLDKTLGRRMPGRANPDLACNAGQIIAHP
jgi:hypothetical protein